MILLFVNFHSSSDLQSVSKKLNVRGRGRESRDRRLYRGAGTEGGNIYVQRKDNNVLLSRNISYCKQYVHITVLGRTTEARNFSIFDTPGSDSFNFGSHHDSIHDSQASLEWDPQGERTPCRSLIILYNCFSLYIITKLYHARANSAR